jgi:hypothetical protein
MTPQTNKLEPALQKFWLMLKREGVITEINMKTRRPLRDVAEIEKLVANRADMVIASSKKVRQEIISLGTKPDQVAVIHNAIEDFWFAHPLAAFAKKPSLIFIGLRGNVDITYLVHDNQVYGLTTGQNSPTTAKGTPSKSNPLGVIDQALNPLAMALAAGGGFIGRGFVGYADHLTQLIMDAIQYKGFAFVDIFQPCVTYNKVNTYQYFYDRLYQLDKSYTVGDKTAAWAKAWEWGEKIPYGLIYRDDTKKDYASELAYLPAGPLAQSLIKPRSITRLQQAFR